MEPCDQQSHARLMQQLTVLTCFAETMRMCMIDAHPKGKRILKFQHCSLPSTRKLQKVMGTIPGTIPGIH